MWEERKDNENESTLSKTENEGYAVPDARKAHLFLISPKIMTKISQNNI